jgi:hypothetical protein
MFTEHKRGTEKIVPKVFEGEKARIEPPKTTKTKVELAGSAPPSDAEEQDFQSSPDLENISMHPLPCKATQSQSQPVPTVPTGNGISPKERIRKRGPLHSKKRRYSNDGPLHRGIRFEAKRRLGCRKFRVQLNELSRAFPPPSNFTTVSPFEREGLSDLRDNDLEAIPAEMLSATGREENSLPDLQHISDPEIRKLALDLCKEYPDLFRKTVSSVEAKVPPFSLLVDSTKWRTRENRLPPRRMDNTREAELRRQIELLLRLGVIRESKAGHYSHAFVVPKPDDKWRLVLDFKHLNQASEVESGWGIPNNQDIMKRLGSHKPKYFAVMDLTAGFHQTPISECESRIHSIQDSLG